MLSSGPWRCGQVEPGFAGIFHAGSSPFFDGRRPVADGKADRWSGAEVFPARVWVGEDPYVDIIALASTLARAVDALNVER